MNGFRGSDLFTRRAAGRRVRGSVTDAECEGYTMNPNRHSRGVRGDWFIRVLFVAVTVALVAACNGSVPSTTSTTTSSTPPTSTTPASTTTRLPASTTTSMVPATTEPVPPDEAVEEAWLEFWDAWVAVRASDPLDAAPLEAVASPQVVDAAVTLFERDRDSNPTGVATDVFASATVVEMAADAAAVEDCVVLAPSFTNTGGIRYEADLRPSDGGWVVTDLRIRSAGGCVPSEFESAAIAGYEAYYEAVAEFWDPPDPSSPLIDEVLVDPRRSSIVALLEEHADRGVAFRSDPTTHPEVIEVRSTTEVVILDCYEPAATDGVFDLETGERLPDEPAIRDGQRNLRSAVMILDEGRWKASDFQGQVDFTCEFAPTNRGLPSV